MKIFSYSSLSLLLSPLRCLELALKWNVHYMQIHTYCLSNTDVATVRLEKQQLTDKGFVGLEHSPEEPGESLSKHFLCSHGATLLSYGQSGVKQKKKNFPPLRPLSLSLCEVKGQVVERGPR